MLIGKKLKELRRKKLMTLKDLSVKSGVQIATLSRMENGKMTGTLESHIAIAKALEMDVTQLYAEIIREDKGAERFETPKQSDVYVHSEKSNSVILTNKVLAKKMMPILLTIGPGGRTNKEQNPLGTEKFIYVLDGKVEIVIANATYPLSKHNTLYFDSSLEHRIINKGKAAAKVLCIQTPVAL